jgi:hypothetical protein
MQLAMKYYEVVPFNIHLTPDTVAAAPAPWHLTARWATLNRTPDGKEGGKKWTR